MGALLGSASRSFDPYYVRWVMDETIKRDETPDPKFVMMVEEFKHIVKKGILAKVCTFIKPFQKTFVCLLVCVD